LLQKNRKQSNSHTNSSANILIDNKHFIKNKSKEIDREVDREVEIENNKITNNVNKDNKDDNKSINYLPNKNLLGLPPKKPDIIPILNTTTVSIIIITLTYYFI